MKILILLVLGLAACGGAVTASPSIDAPPCAPGSITVRLAEPDPTPYTNEYFAACSLPADPDLADLVWCCPGKP